MQTRNIFTHEPDRLQAGSADFLLITLARDNICSLDEASKRDERLFSPMLITYALSKRNPFSAIEIYKLADMTRSCEGAKDVFAQGMAFGRSYELRGNYLILAQTTKNTFQNALNTLSSLKEDTQTSTFEKLSLSCDATVLFCAGFLLEASRRFHVVVGGGLEMALALLVADLLRADVLMRLKSQNITYATTMWATKEQKLTEVLEQLSYTPHAVYTECSLKSAEIKELKNIGAVTEADQAGAGAALAYAVLNGVEDETLVNEMELVVYMA